MKTHRTITLALLISVSLAATACGDDDALVANGSYAVSNVQGHSGADLAAVQAVELTVDRSNRTATFELQSGTQLSFTWSGTSWTRGCPTMQGDTRMEVLEIEDATLMIESMAFAKPIIAADCGSGGNIVLMQADDLGDAGSAPCTVSAEKCLTFQPAP